MNDLLARDLETEFTVAQTTEVKPWEMDLAATRALALQQRPEIGRGAESSGGGIDRRAKKAEYIPTSVEHELPFPLRYQIPS